MEKHEMDRLDSNIASLAVSSYTPRPRVPSSNYSKDRAPSSAARILCQVSIGVVLGSAVTLFALFLSQPAFLSSPSPCNGNGTTGADVPMLEQGSRSTAAPRAGAQRAAAVEEESPLVAGDVAEESRSSPAQTADHLHERDSEGNDARNRNGSPSTAPPSEDTNPPGEKNMPRRCAVETPILQAPVNLYNSCDITTCFTVAIEVHLIPGDELDGQTQVEITLHGWSVQIRRNAVILTYTANGRKENISLPYGFHEDRFQNIAVGWCPLAGRVVVYYNCYRLWDVKVQSSAHCITGRDVNEARVCIPNSAEIRENITHIFQKRVYENLQSFPGDEPVRCPLSASATPNGNNSSQGNSPIIVSADPIPVKPSVP
eukprot:scpid87112/ scgid3465/ 